jgi:glycosyltransferase involved in cell wall biosynthesis
MGGAPIILHLNTETGWRGGEAQTLYLARGLEGRGCRSIIAAPPGSALLERAGAAGIETAAIPMRGELDLRAARAIAELVPGKRIALLHYHTAHAVGLGSLATLFCGRRTAVAARRLSFPLRSRLLGRLKYTWRVDRIIAVSDAIRRRLVARGIAPERIAVVHSGIETERFAHGDRARFRASIASRLPAGPGTVLIGTVGALAAHKGIDLFLEAAAVVAREMPAARFVIVGRGPDEERLRRLADRLGLAPRVLFAGFRDDIPDVFAGLDVFALSSLSGEGSPAVLKEAMAAGVPVAATSLDGVEEIVEDARHGLLTPPGDAPALARAIILLGSDAVLRSRLTSEARRRVAEFTVDRMVEGTVAVYRSLGVMS